MLSFAVVIGIRLIPTMLEDANTIINVARVRELSLYRFKGRNLIKLLRALGEATKYFLYMSVLLTIGSLRRGSNLAIVADLRAFRAKPYQTYLIERRMSKADLHLSHLSL